MKYPERIVDIYSKIQNLLEIGFEEMATTHEKEYLLQLESQIDLLESKLEDECYIYEMETVGDINWNRENDLDSQVSANV